VPASPALASGPIAATGSSPAEPPMPEGWNPEGFKSGGPADLSA
jgi:hypothetical protein